MMRLSMIEKKARELGIRDTHRLGRKELIRLIQKAEGNVQCFLAGLRECTQVACCWRPDCMK
jgi:hypothetical protein